MPDATRRTLLPGFAFLSLLAVGQASPPTIERQPQAQEVVAGLTATFDVLASGAAPLTYQWKKDGLNLPGVTGPRFPLPSVQTNHAGLYSVSVSNADGTTDSAGAWLTVTLPFCAVAPAGIVSWWKAENSDMDELGKNPGGSPTRVAFAPGMIGQAFSFAGSSDVVSLGDPASLKFTDSFSIEGWINIRAYPTPIYGNNTFFGGMIFARGDNTFCYDPYFLGVAPEGHLQFHIEDREQTLFCGQALNSAPLGTGQWHHVGAVFDAANGTMQIFTNGVLAAQTNTTIRPAWLLIPQFNPGVGIGNYGNYAGPGPFNGLIDELAVYQGTLSEDEMSAIYHASYMGKCVIPPSISQEPQDQDLIAGTSATFQVAATGSVPLHYQWQKDGASLVEGGRVSGSTTARLTLAAIQPADAGQYQVLVTNLGGAAYSAVARLIVRLPPKIETAPASQSVVAGSPATLTVTASGDAPLAYQWQKDGTNLVDDGRVLGAGTPSLAMTAAEARDAGRYRAVVTNAYGVATSAEATLTILFPPFLTLPPAPQTVPAGTNVSFAVSAGGTAPLRYQWRFNQAALPGATNVLLNLTNVQSGHAGDYDVVVTNLYGAITSAWATLTVIPSAPWLVLQPRSLVVSVGQPVTLSVLARGSEPMTVQWQRNGVDLAEATHFSLAFPAPVGTDAASYAARVSNAFGSVTTTQAVLSVVPVIAWGRTNHGATLLPAGATSVVAIAAGNPGSGTPCLAVRSDGSVILWGYDKNPGVPVAASNVVAAAIGGGLTPNEPAAHQLVLRDDGTVVAWGANTSEQLNIPAAAGNLVAVAAGGGHCLALRDDGSVLAWGASSSGQTNVPSAATNGIAIAAGGRHSVLLRADGSVLVWGSNAYNQTNVPAQATNLVAVTANGDVTLALRADGVVLGWGGIRRPVSPAATNILAVSAGGAHDLALRADRTILAWGSNRDGQTNPPPYATNVMAIAAGGSHNLALVTDVASPLPPRIGRPPLSRTVEAGQGVVFNALAIGGLPLSSQWYRDGLPLAGQTNPWLSVPNVQPDEAGAYQLVVTNDFGSVTSSVATVTVSVPPPRISHPVIDSRGVSYTFHAFRGTEYVVEYKERLDDPAWLEWERYQGADAPVWVLDPRERVTGRFYRVRAE